MKTNGEWRCGSTHSYSHDWMEMSGQLYPSAALSMEKWPLVPFGRRLCGRQSRLGQDVEEKNPYPCRKCNLGRPPHSIITVLSYHGRPFLAECGTSNESHSWPAEVALSDMMVQWCVLTRRCRCYLYGWGSCSEQWLPVPFAWLPLPLSQRSVTFPCDE
jgi:hypothetical protein